MAIKTRTVLSALIVLLVASLTELTDKFATRARERRINFALD